MDTRELTHEIERLRREALFLMFALDGNTQSAHLSLPLARSLEDHIRKLGDKISELRPS